MVNIWLITSSTNYWIHFTQGFNFKTFSSFFIFILMVQSSHSYCHFRGESSLEDTVTSGAGVSPCVMTLKTNSIIPLFVWRKHPNPTPQFKCDALHWGWLKYLIKIKTWKLGKKSGNCPIQSRFRDTLSHCICVLDTVIVPVGYIWMQFCFKITLTKRKFSVLGSFWSQVLGKV